MVALITFSPDLRIEQQHADVTDLHGNRIRSFRKLVAFPLVGRHAVASSLPWWLPVTRNAFEAIVILQDTCQRKWVSGQRLNALSKRSSLAVVWGIEISQMDSIKAFCYIPRLDVHTVTNVSTNQEDKGLCTVDKGKKKQW